MSAPHRTPRALDTIVADTTLGECATCDPALGRLLRCLAASRLGGVVLQMGRGSVALAAWLVDGMDITSKLVLLHREAGLVEAARGHVGNDIRVAVHSQAPLQFLADVSRNRFDLVVIDDGRADGALLAAVLGLLEPGGMLCLADSEGAAPCALADAGDWLGAREDCLTTPLATPAPLLLAVKLPADSRPVRRGGRSARAAGRTPVTNLR